MQTKPEHRSTRTIAVLGLLIAVTVVISRLLIIPVPMTHGNINLCDAGIMIAALLFGRRGGAVVGGASGFILDLISGYSQYMLFSLVVHGLEGWLVGQLGAGKSKRWQVIAMIVGSIVMIAGYFITDSVLYALPTGIIGVPTNAVQAVVGSVIAFPVVVRMQSYVRTQFN
ncbi:ECF transporter S component [Lactiplantibacillus mudanjiangensis]|uniref:ECF transporter S component [Lactobacillus sp.] n=1 Tax=Lactiplantibacillus mudanjiangensis TaxID=1296538 RepID=A0A660E382_9LACO|nr:ECF transporter S component [Lactiplantibacillus mudanjiangensis]VDG19991.1 ECF transporter S component [Lactobacillus sp.] [Lactiplantibacillus mudanjiangensis]VDG26154.1 ECF transporter S component [Lactobacillus sp.] [Lactiplantibacillus mudanjiangensis]VDG27304.1 ECF transporter S component [Lactobacillus sp.] [Lactiplantibacillus mudanjiangensis]VDG33387.1 ECF transporter S component [Lactobacillus sp.] [Lactiplantibacillus mudanjiangensis]